MNFYGLTLLEMGTLILISEGKSIDEIVKEGYPSIEKFDETIRQIMNKTNNSTWEDLKVLGTQIRCAAKISSTVIEPKIANDYDDLLKEHIEGFCEHYDNLIKEHCISCLNCYMSISGREYICPEQRRLLSNKLDWMDKLITKL